MALLHPFLVLVATLLSLAFISYLGALTLAFLLVRGLVRGEHAKESLLAPLARLGPYPVAFLVLVGALAAILANANVFTYTIMTLALVLLPSLIVALPVSSLLSLLALLSSYGRKIWPALLAFLPPAAACIYLASSVALMLSTYVTGGYVFFFLLTSLAFSISGCVDAVPRAMSEG